MFFSEELKCHSSPCQNGGTCFENSGGYTCTCPENFKGINCAGKCRMSAECTAPVISTARGEAFHLVGHALGSSLSSIVSLDSFHPSCLSTQSAIAVTLTHVSTEVRARHKSTTTRVPVSPDGPGTPAKVILGQNKTSTFPSRQKQPNLSPAASHFSRI